MSINGGSSEEKFLIQGEGGKKEKRKTGIAAVDYSSLKFTYKDKYLITANIFTTFGGAIELYLPGMK